MNWHGHTVVMGRSGSGKTWYMNYILVPKLHSERVPVFLWLGGHDPEPLRVPSIYVRGTHTVKDILTVLDAGKHVVCYRPDVRQKVADAELLFWQQTLMRRFSSRTVVVLDEAQRYAPQGSIDTGAHLLATGGRKHGIECYFVCQRVAELSKTIAAQCAHWIIFEHSQIDSDYLRDRGLQLSDAEIAGLQNVKYTYVRKKL